MDRPEGVVDFVPDPTLYPFTSRWFDSPVGPVHYVDEGTGRPLLLLHGNPDWSFLYRRMIADLRREYRCIAPDYPGFGLSAHPASGYGYTPAEHAEVVGALVDHLDLRGAVVFGQDWGGPIGLEVASRRPDRFDGLVMANTWFWPADDAVLERFSAVMSSRLLQWLIVNRNLFVTPLMRRTVKRPLSDAEFAHYTDVVPTPAHRTGIAEFPRQIRGAHDWLAALERRVQARLSDKTVALAFGRRDVAFGRAAVVERWRRSFPTATVLHLPGADHYVQEDAPDRLVELIRRTFPVGRPVP